jgi:maltooligosyltrehalose trehalohydrolase
VTRIAEQGETRLVPSPRPGAVPLGDGRCGFRVWAPHSERVAVRLVSPRERLVSLEPRTRGWHEGVLEDCPPGATYFYRLANGAQRPDPASRFQPEGPHGPSQVVESAFEWTDSHWLNPPLARHIIYELHVGTFTPQGTFEAIIPRLDDLLELGITALELMPIAQFPGGRNWGYDGVCLYAAQNTYGGPRGLKMLVDACHQRGLAVFLDVVYNHLGPEGNYLLDFGPYFTDRYRTPWGEALNFSGPGSDDVREFFIHNALYWVEECHIDALRLDAIHAIMDPSPVPIVEELAAAVHEAGERLGRRIQVIAESAANDARVITSRELNGYGCDAQWNDDFHHALRTLLTGEQRGYYASYGELRHMARALTDGFVYAGEYSVFHARRHGRSSRAIPAERFVVFCQNHDQVGNRMLGERLTQSVDFEAAKLAAATVLLSPYVPLLFMGEEYAEPAPFQYFISHTDAELVEAVRRGRREEFENFEWEGEAPDPQDEATFRACKLDWRLRRLGRHREMLEYYKALIRLRRQVPSLAFLSKDAMEMRALEGQRIIIMRRSAAHDESLIILNFEGAPARVELRTIHGSWERLLDSSEERFGGGSALTPPAILADANRTVEIGPHAAAVFLHRRT